MQPLLEAWLRKRRWYLLAVVVTIAAGLASRRYAQVLPACLGKYPGDALWSLMVFFGLGILFRKASSLQLGLGTLGFAFGIEALKLCQVPWLVNIRHSTVGHLVFGQVFAWQNLVAYTIGAIVGVLIELLFRSHRRASGNRQPV
jgi:hypothetical protein